MSELTELKLLDLLNSSESQFVERKASMPRVADTRKALVAFANSVGEHEYGILFIGIGDKGEKLGVSNADEIQREIRKIAENDCYPPIKCEPRLLRVSNLEIVAVVVPFSTNRPHFAGHAFIRQGSENVKASREMFDELIASRNDKARKILSERGKLISVKFKDGSPLPATDAYLIARDDRDYQVTKCDAHVVEFKDANMGWIYDVPLEHLAIGYDGGRQRLQLVICK